jgi:hypothetical protein
MHFKLCLLCQLINVTNNVTARRRDKKREKKFGRRIIFLSSKNRSDREIPSRVSLIRRQGYTDCGDFTAI